MSYSKTRNGPPISCTAEACTRARLLSDPSVASFRSRTGQPRLTPNFPTLGSRPVQPNADFRPPRSSLRWLHDRRLERHIAVVVVGDTAPPGGHVRRDGERRLALWRQIHHELWNGAKFIT